MHWIYLPIPPNGDFLVLLLEVDHHFVEAGCKFLGHLLYVLPKQIISRIFLKVLSSVKRYSYDEHLEIQRIHRPSVLSVYKKL